MSHEDEIATIMSADDTLMAILTGGVFKSGTVGIDGITREVAPTAFDANGYLEPCALVRQRGNVPTSDVKDYEQQVVSATQVVEIYVYQDTGYDQIDLALARLYTLLFGEFLSDSFELDLVNVIDRGRDTGALNGASLARQDWVVDFVMS